MNDRASQNLDPATAEKLRTALLRLNARRVAVPSRVDETILQAAREHLDFVVGQASRLPSVSPKSSTPQGGQDAPPTTPSWLEELRAGALEFFGERRWARLGAVAVAMIAVGALAWLGGHPRWAARPEDLNGDGVVDMLDAFALARELQQNPASHPQLDLNGDGKVDARDVQALAARAVSLETGGRS